MGDAGGDKERDPRAEPPTFLDHFVEKDDNDPSGNELAKDKYRSIEVKLPVSPSDDVSKSFKDGHEDGEDFLGAGVKGAVFGVRHINVNDFGADEDLPGASVGFLDVASTSRLL